MTNSDDLIQSLRKHLIQFSADIPISPANLANEAMRDLDPDNIAPELVSWGCVLHLRSLAGKLLAKEFDPVAQDDTQQELFEGLQDRYPGVGKNKGKYMPRLAMTYEDRLHNIDRLRKEAKAKLAHADALEAETLSLIDQGLLDAAIG